MVSAKREFGKNSLPANMGGAMPTLSVSWAGWQKNKKTKHFEKCDIFYFFAFAKKVPILQIGKTLQNFGRFAPIPSSHHW